MVVAIDLELVEFTKWPLFAHILSFCVHLVIIPHLSTHFNNLATGSIFGIQLSMSRQIASWSRFCVVYNTDTELLNGGWSLVKSQEMRGKVATKCLRMQFFGVLLNFIQAIQKFILELGVAMLLIIP